MIRTGWECTEDKFLVEILKYNDNESKTTFLKIYKNLLDVCEDLGGFKDIIIVMLFIWNVAL
jgi:hypothetical protein